MVITNKSPEPIGNQKAFAELKCIICQSSQHELRFSAVADWEYYTYKPVDYLICNSCGLISQFPIPEANLLPSFYPSDYRNYLPPGDNRLVESLKSLQMKWFASRIVGYLSGNQKASVLDLGFGNGQLLLALSNLGFKNLFGSDFTSGAFPHLQNRGIKLKFSNIEKEFPFDDCFDCIILNNVIEHFCDPISVLSSVKKHLTKQGIVVMVTPNANALEVPLFGKYWAGLHAPRHIFLFNDRNAKMLATKLAFASATIEAFNDPGQWAISLQNILQAKSSTKSSLHYGLAWYTTFVSLVCAPIVAVQSLMNKSTAILCLFKRSLSEQ